MNTITLQVTVVIRETFASHLLSFEEVQMLANAGAIEYEYRRKFEKIGIDPTEIKDIKIEVNNEEK